MDLKQMVQTIFSPENLAKMTKDTGLGTDEVKSVLGKAVPFLANADNKEKGEAEAIRAISEEAGVSEGGTKSVLTDMLPMLMGLMGGGADTGSSSTLDSAFSGSAAGGNTLDNAFGGNAFGSGNVLNNAFGGSAQEVDLSGGNVLGGDSAAEGMDMFSMLSSLFGGMGSEGMDMSDLFGGMLGGGQGQDLTLESGPAPAPAQTAPTIEQAFTQADQAAEEVQEEVQQENPGGLLGLLSGLFRKK